MTDGRGEIVKSAAELLSKRISLRELEHQIGMPNPIVNCPIFVHVVASKLKTVPTALLQSNCSTSYNFFLVFQKRK